MDLVIPLSLGFTVALGAAWLLLFPATLDAVLGRVRWLAARAGQRVRRLGQRLGTTIDSSRGTGAGLVSGASGWLRNHGPLLGGGFALMLLPVAVLLLFSDQRRLAGFEDRARVENRVVTALLEGEQLVPPPPLPPDIFVTRDVVQVRPDLGSADRDWSHLDPDFAQTLLHLFKTMEARGYPMVLIEGYRSPERQASLQASGTGVTNAGAWQSYHQFRLAADCAFFRDGVLVISERDPWAAEGYRVFGDAAAAAGLTWGGGWTLRDLGHVERHKPGLLKK